jgi:hypothetical protein
VLVSLQEVPDIVATQVIYELAITDLITDTLETLLKVALMVEGGKETIHNIIDFIKRHENEKTLIIITQNHYFNFRTKSVKYRKVA